MFKNSAGVEFEHELWPPLGGEVAPTNIPFFGLIGPYKVGKSTWIANAHLPRHKGWVADTHNGWSNLIRDNMTVEVFADKKWEDLSRAVKAVKPGEYDSITFDTLSDVIELAKDYVDANSKLFGGVNRKSRGLFYSAAYGLVDELLDQAIARVQTVFAVAHEGERWAGGEPTGERKPDWSKVFDKLCTVGIWQTPVEKRPEPKSFVYFSRLSYFKPAEDEWGDPVTMAVLPRQLKHPGSPAVFRSYLMQPVPWDQLSKEELEGAESYVTEILSEDARLVLETKKAEAEAEAEAARTEREAIRAGQQDLGKAFENYARTAHKRLGFESINDLRNAIEGLGVEWSVEKIGEIEKQLKENGNG